jgi:hypothetical protein
MNTEELVEELVVEFTPETLFTKAQTVAKEIAAVKGTVTSDDVYTALEAAGEDISKLGTSAGNLFRSGFVFTGTEVRSARPSNRGRKIRVWKLVGETV